MAIDLFVEYKDEAREAGYFPFAFQRYARAYWWPIAERLGLERLQRLECLVIHDLAEAEALVAEIQAFGRYVEAAPRSEIAPEHRAYLLERIEQVVPFLRDVIAEWDQVDHIWL